MLSEKFVQKKALSFLKRRYRLRARSRILARMEVTTLPKYGRKRADGLLTFKHILWGRYVVSMEAKSQKTLSAIRPSSAKNIQRWNSFKAGFYLLLVSGSLLTLYKIKDGVWQYLLPLSIFFIGSWLFYWLTPNWSINQKAPVFKQLGQYPANEQWVAISKDALKALSRKKKSAFFFICKRKGVGLVIVNSLGLSYTKIYPRKKRVFRKFTKYYIK